MYLLTPTADSLKHLIQKQRCSLQRISVKFIYLKYIIVLWDNLSSFSLKIGLHVCDRNKRKTNIWKNQVATPHFWERFLQIADSCLFLWELPRCEPKCPQQWSDIQPQALRICKKRTQKVLMFATGFFEIFVFLLFLSHTPEVYSNHYTVCMLNGTG